MADKVPHSVPPGAVQLRDDPLAQVLDGVAATLVASRAAKQLEEDEEL